MCVGGGGGGGGVGMQHTTAYSLCTMCIQCTGSVETDSVLYTYSIVE